MTRFLFAVLALLVVGATNGNPKSIDSALKKCLADFDKTQSMTAPAATDHAPPSATAEPTPGRAQILALHMVGLQLCMKQAGFTFDVAPSEQAWDDAVAAKFGDREGEIDSNDPDLLEIQQRFMRDPKNWKPLEQ